MKIGSATVVTRTTGQQEIDRRNKTELPRDAPVQLPHLAACETCSQLRSLPNVDGVGDAQLSELRGRLSRHRAEIHRLVAEHRAMNPRVVGSVARGEATATSDVDVLVDFTAHASFFDEIGLRLALTDLLHVEVDLVASDTLRGDLRERVLREAVPL